MLAIFLGITIIIIIAIAYVLNIIRTNSIIIESQFSKLKELQRKEERYRALFNNTIVGMVNFSRHHWNVNDVNHSLLNTLELTNQREFQDIFHSMLSDVEQTILDGLQKSQSFQDCEIIYKTKSGKQLIFLFSGREDLSDHNIHGVLIDITEKRRLEESFVRAQKMEALSLLTSSIAHDLQNVFAPLHLSLKLLEKQVRSHRGKKILKATKNSTTDGQLLVSNILSIAKGIKKEFKHIHLNALFRSVFQSFSPGRSIKVEFINTLKKSDVMINGNENQLKQMFLNILRNSREAIAKKGHIVVKIEEERKTDRLERKRMGDLNRFITVTITDDGQGIAEESLQKVFEPFFTTKRNSGGTGLGLSMVAEIVKQHSGWITIDSKVHIGTAIVITLPIVQHHAHE
ncbi:MAG: ATP-binding protein [Bacteroidota bacterium]